MIGRADRRLDSRVSRSWWAMPSVRAMTSPAGRVVHPQVGDVVLTVAGSDPDRAQTRWSLSQRRWVRGDQQVRRLGTPVVVA